MRCGYGGTMFCPVRLIGVVVTVRLIGVVGVVVVVCGLFDLNPEKFNIAICHASDSGCGLLENARTVTCINIGHGFYMG